jgi:hypothetical protein
MKIKKVKLPYSPGRHLAQGHMAPARLASQNGPIGLTRAQHRVHAWCDHCVLGVAVARLAPAARWTRCTRSGSDNISGGWWTYVIRSCTRGCTMEMGGGAFSPAWRLSTVETDVEAARCSSRCSGSSMGTRGSFGAQRWKRRELRCSCPWWHVFNGGRWHGAAVTRPP